jgi:sugar lactone lactonase YvrE
MATERLTVVRVPGNGAEDVLIGPKGHVWTATEDGSVFRLTPDGHLVERVATTGGRPLGLELLGDGRILVCDGDRGLLAVDPGSGSVEVLTSHVDGQPLRFCNNAAVHTDGRIFFTDTSSVYSVHQWKNDLVEATRSGRLLVRHTDGSVDVVLSGLEFANGVALSADESYVAVAETGARTVVRHWLTGRHAGTHDYLAEDLPGYPDNMSRGTDGLIWVAIASPLRPGRRAAQGRARCRCGAGRSKLPPWAQPKPKRTARVMAFDDDGQVVHDRMPSTPPTSTWQPASASITAGSGSAASSKPAVAWFDV